MKALIPICWLAIGSATAFGNGGTFSTSDVYATGNLAVTKKQNISLDKESLSIELSTDSASVGVDYTLINHGGATKVTCGFPVDSQTDTLVGNNDGGDSGIKSFSMDDNGTRMSITKVIKMPGDR
ncbi:MAG: hypothetical protein QM796_01345 [Chthoniobacteraceae bacterium]